MLVPVIVVVATGIGQWLIGQPVMGGFLFHVVPGVVLRGKDLFQVLRVFVVYMVSFLDNRPAQPVDTRTGLDPASVDQYLLCLLPINVTK
ncbi:hypothetical protein [Pseudomonas syringae]|uniref:hypothetical protein n=1 Tax=Pseudomonas syringae TaxID=317 RepID=UPI001E6025FF|nr:hypothetical protein [Pseudomonas syringae]